MPESRCRGQAFGGSFIDDAEYDSMTSPGYILGRVAARNEAAAHRGNHAEGRSEQRARCDSFHFGQTGMKVTERASRNKGEEARVAPRSSDGRSANLLFNILQVVMDKELNFCVCSCRRSRSDILLCQDFLPPEKKKKPCKCDLCDFTSEQREWHRLKCVGRKESPGG